MDVFPRNMVFVRRLLLLLVVAVLAVALVACSKGATTAGTGSGTDTGGGDAAAPSDAPALKVGSKDFTENLILGELYALALEDKGIAVERQLGLASSAVHEVLLKGDVDLYPEYTGTGLLAVLKLPLETDPQKVYDTVKAEYAKQFKVDWLDFAPANDGQGLVVTKAAADKYNLTTISDFQREAAKLRFASQGEFDVRDDGIPRLEEVYGPLKFKSSKIYDNALKYEVMSSGEADAAPAYTTEGQLTDPAFVLLQDDKNAWPPYNIAPVIRQDALTAVPTAAAVLNALAPGLTTEVVTQLNAQVDVEGREYDEVAREYYDSIKESLPAAPAAEQ